MEDQHKQDAFPPKTVAIHSSGPESYRADPSRGHQNRGGDVSFENRTGDDVRLEFSKDGTPSTPFDGSQPYPVDGHGSLPLTVRGDAETGKYRYTITKAVPAAGIPEESPATSEVGQKYSSRALTRAGTVGSNPEMIID